MRYHVALTLLIVFAPLSGCVTDSDGLIPTIETDIEHVRPAKYPETISHQYQNGIRISTINGLL
ncbi:MAG: hypothetical protein ACJZ59_07365 [Candidatus Thalassarchaeaceae archaeon]